MSSPEKVEVKKEKNDDVLADIMKDDDHNNYEDEEMADARPLSIASPVSPPMPSNESESREKEQPQSKEKEATKQTNDKREKSPKKDNHDKTDKDKAEKKEKNDSEKGEKTQNEGDSNENSSRIKQEPTDDNTNALLTEKARILKLSAESSSSKSKPKGDIKPEGMVKQSI